MCEDCLALLAPIASVAVAKSSPDVYSDTTSKDFESLCRSQSWNSTACSDIALTILMGESNLAARAGMMCADLGLCGASLGCDALNAASFGGSGEVLTGGLDLCAAEGVVGGTDTALPSAAVTSSSCRTQASCSSGQVCYFPDDEDAIEQVCACTEGEDVCYDIGACTSYCDLASTKTQVTRLNAGAKACSPGAEVTGCDDGDVCVAKSTCQRWDCDSATQSLVSATCSGLCRPSNLAATQARISNDGKSVVLKLNAYAGVLTNAKCSNVFDSASMELLGGSSLCTTSDDSLTVKLTSTAKLAVGSSLTFLSSGSVLVAQVDDTAAFAGSVTVLTCSNCTSPKAALTGQIVVTQPCTSGGLLGVAGSIPPSFDASLSTDPSGRSTWSNVLWSLDEAVGGADGRAILQAAVDRANANTDMTERLVLSMQNSEVIDLPEAYYKLRVTVLSWLGTNSTASLTFLKTNSATAPAVKVIGASEQTFRIASGMRASASAGSTCGKTLDWLWTSPSSWSGLSAATGLTTPNVYRAAPVPALHGQSISLRASASFVGIDNSLAFDDVSMSAVGSTPSAKLTGAGGDVPDDTVLSLDATGSSDPDSTTSKLTYKWDCRREDYPAPCFTGSDSGDSYTSPGVWSLPPSLLTRDKQHTITVTVSKSVMKGASPLKATASVTFRPRDASQAFPRGTLERQCGPAECAFPHSTSKDLTLQLTLDSKYSDAAVSWSSAEVEAVAGLKASLRSTGTYLLTIPAASLPSGFTSITITANLALNGITGSAIVTVPLNAAPFCSLDPSNPSTCVKAVLASSTFPTAVATLRAQGWSDDLDSQLTYEYGIRTATGDRAQSIAVASSAAIVGLPIGAVTLYVCAKDSYGSKTCGTTAVTINAPGADFDAAALMASIDLSSLSSDPTEVQQAAAQLALLSAYIAANSNGTPSPSNGASGKATDAQITLASTQTTQLINSILSTTNMADSQQVQLALASIANTASSNAGLLNAAAQAVVLNALTTIANALLSSGSVDSAVATNLLNLANAAAPDASTSTVTSTSALEWLRALIVMLTKLATSMGKAAVPGATYTPTGSAGVFLSVAAPPTATAASAVSFTIRAGSGASALATALGGRRSALSVYGNTLLERAERGDPLALPSSSPSSASVSAAVVSTSSSVALARRRRRLLATPPPPSVTALSTVTAEAYLVLSGSAAAGANGYSIGWAYAPAAETVLPVAMGGVKPSTVDLRGALSYLVWTAASSSAAASPPTLDGVNSYIRVSIPAPGYDTTKIGTCILYDVTANAISGSLSELSAGSSPASFESYDATTGRVVCRATAAGVYVVAQNQQSALASPPPSPPPPSNPAGVSAIASPPPPPTINNTTQVGTTPSPAVDPAASPPPPEGGGKKSNGGAIAGGVIAALVAIAVGVAVYLYLKRRREKTAPEAAPAAEGEAAVEAPAALSMAVAPVEAAEAGEAGAGGAPSSRPGSAAASRPGSAAASRPGSAAVAPAPGSGAASNAASRAGSANAAAIGAAAAAATAEVAAAEGAEPDTPRSARSSGSAVERAQSPAGLDQVQELEDEQVVPVGDGPSSPVQTPPSRTASGERPLSARPPRPPSALQSSRPPSAGPQTPLSARSSQRVASASTGRLPTEALVLEDAEERPPSAGAAPPRPLSRGFGSGGNLEEEGSVAGGRKSSLAPGVDFEMPNAPREQNQPDAPPTVTLAEVAAAVAAAEGPGTGEILQLAPPSASVTSASPREPATIDLPAGRASGALRPGSAPRAMATPQWPGVEDIEDFLPPSGQPRASSPK